MAPREEPHPTDNGTPSPEHPSDPLLPPATDRVARAPAGDPLDARSRHGHVPLRRFGPACGARGAGDGLSLLHLLLSRPARVMQLARCPSCSLERRGTHAHTKSSKSN